MAKSLYLTLIAVVLLCCAAIAQFDTSTNLVANGDAEHATDFYAWFHSGGTSIAADNAGGSGAQSFEMDNTPTGGARDIRTEPFAVMPGELLQWNFSYKTLPGSTGTLWAFIRWWENDNNQGFLGQTIVPLALTNDTWTTIGPTEINVHAQGNFCDVAFYADTFAPDNDFVGVCRFDNINISRQGEPSAENFSPQNNEEGVDLYTTLAWDAAGADISYDLYLGANLTAVTNADTNSPEYLDTIPAAAATRMQYAVTLHPYTEYYWRIDTHRDGETITGAVSRFTTAFNLIEDAVNADFVRYHLQDSRGETMGCVKVIENPEGGYLAVYHVYIYKGSIGDYEFDSRVASSDDLVNWTYRGTLASNTSMPTIAYHPETGGYVVAHEQWTSRGSSGAAHLRFHYYASTANLLLQLKAQDYTAPITLSPWSLEGTPNIYSISADGATIDVGFHYNSGGSDRNGRGTLTGLLAGSPSWTTYEETALNNLLISKGVGSHIGDRDSGPIWGQTYRIQETMMVADDWSTWKGWFYDESRQDFFRTYLQTAGGSTSWGNGTFTYLTLPNGADGVVVGYFIFGEGAAPGEGGPMLFYTELQTKAWRPIPGDTATDTDYEPTLQWLAGAGAMQHDVYFGVDASTVAAADTGSPVYLGRFSKPHVDITDLIAGTTYYWRVDEVQADDTTRTGPVWQLTTTTGAGLRDLSILAGNWLNENHPACTADLTGDCKVDMDDFALLNARWAP